MKKLFVHLSMLALLAALLVPMVGCNKEEKTEEETPPATSATPAPAETSPAMTSDMGGSMGTDMGGGTSSPMGSDMAPKK